MEIENAVDNALNAMPEDFGIKKLLIANKAEVKQMCLTEYNEAETMEQFREEGIEEGRVLRLIEIIYKKMLKGKTNDEIAEAIEEDVRVVGQIMQSILEYKKNYGEEQFDPRKVLKYYQI